jgi:rare lipoprotein A
MEMRGRVCAVVIVTAVILSACTARPPSLQPPPAAPGPYVEVGMASWYGHRHQGRRTADGERYNMNAMTAAHRTLPFGTIVRVTNLENHRSVRVRINDRGPYVDHRILDLSAAAARSLGIKAQGVADVRIEVVDQ